MNMFRLCSDCFQTSIPRIEVTSGSKPHVTTTTLEKGSLLVYYNASEDERISRGDSISSWMTVSVAERMECVEDKQLGRKVTSNMKM